MNINIKAMNENLTYEAQMLEMLRDAKTISFEEYAQAVYALNQIKELHKKIKIGKIADGLYITEKYTF